MRQPDFAALREADPHPLADPHRIGIVGLDRRGHPHARRAVDIDHRQRERHFHIGQPRLVIDREGIDRAGSGHRARVDRTRQAARADKLRGMDRRGAIVTERDSQFAALAPRPEGNILRRELGQGAQMILRSGLQLV
jgi:hypothetical protein